MFGHIEVAPIFTVESGRPVNPLTGIDSYRTHAFPLSARPLGFGRNSFRSPMLATLEPVGGSRQALWMAAFFFGIGHYFGTPGGILGGIASIFMGWILGKAMVETRGFVWAWWIHFLSDFAIFTFLTLALLK